MENCIIGIDVSKHHLDVHRLPDGAVTRVPNTPKGYRALLQWIGDAAERIVFEATGPYHRAMEVALGKAGLPLCKVNPRQARRFADAIGVAAKTDKVDAALLARFGAMISPEVRPAPAELLIALKE